MKDLYIFGAGRFGREVAWLAERINKNAAGKEEAAVWNIRGFIDDNEKVIGKVFDGYKVLGSSEYLERICDTNHSENKDTYVVCAVGNAKIRKKIIEKISGFSNISFATLIDPSVICSDRVEIGRGTIICAGSILTVDIRIGCHVIINLDCTLGHDDVIDDYVTMYPSVNVSGNVHVGECAELGTGMQIIQGMNIGQNAILGAGTVVVKDIPADCTAVGCPAKIIKK